MKDKAATDVQACWSEQRAALYEAVTEYYHGLLYLKGSPVQARRRISGAAQKLVDFLWDNDRNLLGGYAYLYWGLCKKALGQPKDAVSYFSTAAGYPMPVRKTHRRAYREWSELSLRAYDTLGKYCNELGRRDGQDYRLKALVKFRLMRKKIPDVWTRRSGVGPLLEYIRTLISLRRYREAQRIAMKVATIGEKLRSSTDWGATASCQANKLLYKIILQARLAGVDLESPPDILFKAAMAEWHQRSWHAAIQGFQAVISSWANPKEGHIVRQAWRHIADAYDYADDYLAAYYACDHIMRTFPKDQELCHYAAYCRYCAITARASITRSPRDEAMVEKARKSL